MILNICPRLSHSQGTLLIVAFLKKNHTEAPNRLPTYCTMTTNDSDGARRLQELEALESFYGEDVRAEDRALGPWRIKIASSVDLEIRLPARYPSQQAPIPCLYAPPFVVDERRLKDMEAEMSDMYQEDTEVIIMWAEHARATLGDTDFLADTEEEAEESSTKTPQNATNEEESSEGGTRVFHPYTSKFGQPIRQFDEEVFMNESNRRVIHRGEPYHPPKSGPAETLVAHVASVESMDHVNWVLAELLLNDKKVAKASHNMIAYRFWDEDRGCLVSDNDDDGEKGAGAKLASLLEMADARNVIVVVSRWYGGIHLGSSRFKYFASTARDALQDAGFIENKK